MTRLVVLQLVLIRLAIATLHYFNSFGLHILCSREDEVIPSSMIPKSGCRFSEKIMLKQQAKAKFRNQNKIISL